MNPVPSGQVVVVAGATRILGGTGATGILGDAAIKRFGRRRRPASRSAAYRRSRPSSDRGFDGRSSRAASATASASYSSGRL